MQLVHSRRLSIALSGRAKLWTSTAVAILATLVGASETHANETAKLQFEGIAGDGRCSTDLALREEVAAKLGYDPFAPTASRVVEATIHQGGGELQGRVQIAQASGKNAGRSLHAKYSECEALLGAMALTIAMALDPVAAMHDPKTSAPALPPAELPPAELPPLEHPTLAPIPTALAALPQTVPQATSRLLPERPPSVEPPGPRYGILRIPVGIAVAGGSPAPAALIGIEAGLRRDAWSAFVGGRLVLPSSHSIGSGSVSASLVLASIGACGHLHVLSLCATGYFGSLQGEAHDIEVPEAKSTFFASAGLRALVDIPLGKTLFIGPWAEAAATLTRTRLLLRGAPVWSTEPLALNAGLMASIKIQ